MATCFGDEERRQQATQSFIQLDSLHITENINPYSDTLTRNVSTHLLFRRSKDARKRLEALKDDAAFRNSVTDAEAMSVKEYSKWQWDIFEDILNSALLSHFRFDDILKNFKFPRKLLQFYNPSSLCFSELKRNKVIYNLIQN